MSIKIWHHEESDKHVVPLLLEDKGAKKFRIKIKNSRGFALAETIVALLILSFALVGLLTMVQYARVRAIANYNDRYVLFRLDGEMQKIKHHRQNSNDFGPLNQIVFLIPGVSGYSANEIAVTVNFTRTTAWDTSIAQNIGYHMIVGTAEWTENLPRLGGRNVRAERRFITLREDYFFERVIQQ